jgi:hypothetical protein
MTRSHGPLHTACQEGAHEVVQLLLNKGWSLYYTGWFFISGFFKMVIV